jgi:putative hydrolase of the HAD superfamily
MIKGVFFDLYHTLITYQPSQAELEAKALGELGVVITPEALKSPILTADEFIYNEIARQPLSYRSREEKIALYLKYQETVIEQAGLAGDTKLAMALLEKMQQAKMNLVLFDDVAPVLTGLRQRGLTLGLISNIEDNMTVTLEKLGLTSLLDIIVTSQDAGANKPQPEIFFMALERAGVEPAEAMYIGDQYRVDVLGARAVGIQGILLDRADHHREITDCPRIQSLNEIADLLE